MLSLEKDMSEYLKSNISSFAEYINVMKSLHFVSTRINNHEEKLLNLLWYDISQQLAKRKNNHVTLADILKTYLVSILIGSDQKIQRKYVLLAQNRNSYLKKDAITSQITCKPQTSAKKKPTRQENLLKCGVEYNNKLLQKIKEKKSTETLNCTFNPDIRKSANTGQALSKINVDESMRKKKLYSSKQLSKINDKSFNSSNHLSAFSPQSGNMFAKDAVLPQTSRQTTLNHTMQLLKSSIDKIKGTAFCKKEEISHAALESQKVVP
jgi:hypothetical protein